MYSTAFTFPGVASRRPCIESSAKMYNLVARSAAVMAGVVLVGTCVRGRISTSQLVAGAAAGSGLRACCALADVPITATANKGAREIFFIARIKGWGAIESPELSSLLRLDTDARKRVVNVAPVTCAGADIQVQLRMTRLKVSHGTERPATCICRRN